MNYQDILPAIQQGLAAYESDYYAVLGIPLNASETDIKEAYSTLIKRLQSNFKPNHLHYTKANEILRNWIQPAYAILTDTEQRFEYNAILKQQIQRIQLEEIRELWPSWRYSNHQDRDPNWAYNYSRSVSHLNESLYCSFETLTDVIVKISFLNLGYLLMSCGFDINVNFEDVFTHREPRELGILDSPSTALLVSTEIDATLHNELLTSFSPGETRFEQSLQMVARGQYKEAIQYLSFAISQDSTQSVYYALRGIAYHRQGFKGMARADYQRALNLDRAEQHD